MAYKAKAYTLREESTESGIRYFISFKDGQGEHCKWCPATASVAEQNGRDAELSGHLFL